jgi:hypothetical protein
MLVTGRPETMRNRIAFLLGMSCCVAAVVGCAAGFIFFLPPPKPMEENVIDEVDPSWLPPIGSSGPFDDDIPAIAPAPREKVSENK